MEPHDFADFIADLRAKIRPKKRPARLPTPRQRVLDHYGHRCMCCGVRHAEFLRCVGMRAEAAWRLIRRHAPPGPPEFRILCYNCRWAEIRHGSCPHKRRV